MQGFVVPSEVEGCVFVPREKQGFLDFASLRSE